MLYTEYKIKPDKQSILDAQYEITQECLKYTENNKKALLVSLTDEIPEEINIKQDDIEYRTYWKISKGISETALKNIYSKFLGYLKKRLETTKHNLYLAVVSEDKLRSDKQNAWWWGECIDKCFLPNIQALSDKARDKEGLSRIILTKDDIHYRIINTDVYEIWDSEWDTVITDPVTGEKKHDRRTSNLTTTQFARMMENARVSAGRLFNTVLELPDFEKEKNYSDYKDLESK